MLLRHFKNFFNFYNYFMPIFFLQKCHHAARSTGGMKVPPDEPAAGALQKAYTRFIRRKGNVESTRAL